MMEMFEEILMTRALIYQLRYPNSRTHIDIARLIPAKLALFDVLTHATIFFLSPVSFANLTIAIALANIWHG